MLVSDRTVFDEVAVNVPGFRTLTAALAAPEIAMRAAAESTTMQINRRMCLPLNEN